MSGDAKTNVAVGHRTAEDWPDAARVVEQLAAVVAIVQPAIRAPFAMMAVKTCWMASAAPSGSARIIKRIPIQAIREPVVEPAGLFGRIDSRHRVIE